MEGNSFEKFLFEVGEFVSLHTDSFTDKWDEKENNEFEFVDSLSISTCACYILIALSAISCQYHRRLTAPADRNHVSSILYGIFTHQLHGRLDDKLYEKVFADTAFIDACFEDNVRNNTLDYIKSNIHYVLDSCGKKKGGFLSSFIKAQPVSWFDSSYKTLEAISLYCIGSALDTANHVDKHGKLVSLGPDVVLSCVIVDKICEEIMNHELMINFIAVTDDGLKGQFNMFRAFLSRFSEEDLDHMLLNPDDVF